MKKIIIAALGLCLAGLLFTGCSAVTDAVQQAKAIASAATEDAAQPAETAAPDAEPAQSATADEKASYDSWGINDWKNATDAEKEQVCLYVIRASEPKLKDISDEDIVASGTLGTIEGLIDSWFELDDKETIGNFVAE